MNSKKYLILCLILTSFSAFTQTTAIADALPKKDSNIFITKTDTPTTQGVINSKTLLTQKAEVKNIKILNGTKDDFSPLYFENGLLFCSNSRKVKKGEDADKVPDDLNLKYALFDSVGNLARPSSFGKRTNSKTHEGPSCFSKGGDSLFLTRNMSKGGIDKKSKNGLYTLKIYLKVRDSLGAFVGDKLFPFELSDYSYCHPTLSPDGKRLYFSSNMPGGFGGMDLYMIRKVNDSTWTSPINLGARVNTPKNEVFPFMKEDGMLYFSSNGLHKGRGGLDIYMIDIEKRNGMAIPLSESFNSEKDDFGIMFLPNDGRKGYFSSNRLGGAGGDDIYSFEVQN